jgi:hypothetical protein
VVIRGETYHFEIVAGESARGIMALTLDGLAIGNGILTVENEAQALARAAAPTTRRTRAASGQGGAGDACSSAWIVLLGHRGSPASAGMNCGAP